MCISAIITSLPFTPRDGKRDSKNHKMTDNNQNNNANTIDANGSSQTGAGTVTIAEIEKLAGLSRLEISEEEKQTFADQIGSILKYVNQLKEVVSNTARPLEPANFPHRNVMREDVDNRDLVLDTKKLVELAPESQDGFVKVKKILN